MAANNYVPVPKEGNLDEKKQAALRNYRKHQAGQGTFFHCGWCLALFAVVALVLLAGGQVVWDILVEDHYRRHHGKLRHGRADRGLGTQPAIDDGGDGQ